MALLTVPPLPMNDTAGDFGYLPEKCRYPLRMAKSAINREASQRQVECQRLPSHMLALAAKLDHSTKK